MEDVVADRLSTAIRQATGEDHVHPHGLITDVKKNQRESTKKKAEGSQSHDSVDLKAEEDSLSLDDHEYFHDFRDDEADLLRRLERHLRVSSKKSRKNKQNRDNSSMQNMIGDERDSNDSLDDEYDSEDGNHVRADTPDTNLMMDFQYGDIIERTPEEIFETFLSSYRGFLKYKELLIRDGFDDMESLIYAKKSDLLDIMPEVAAERFYKVLKREKPHWKKIYKKRREQLEIERAEEREREEHLKREEEGWFVGEYDSEEDALDHNGFHDGHDDY